MSIPSVGIDIHSLYDNLNSVFNATMTRIRRCFVVKNAAIQRIRSAEVKARGSGYYHLDKIINFQIEVYGSYLEQYGKVRLPPDLQEQIARLEQSDTGLVGKWFTRKRKLRDAIISLENKFSSIHKKVSVLYQIIINQREVLKVVPYQEVGQISLFPTKEESRRIRKSRNSNIAEEETQRLMYLIDEEEMHSNELIRELKTANDILLDAMSTASETLQKSFAKFVKDARRFSDERVQSLKTFLLRAAYLVSAYYALKVISVWAAEGAMLYLGEDQLKELIFIIQYRILKYDNLADTLVAMPAVYAVMRSGIPSLKGVVEEGINRCKEAYNQGQLELSRALKQFLLAKKSTVKIPDFLQ